MQNCVVILTFFCFRPEVPFSYKFDSKIQNCLLKWNLVPRLVRIPKIQWWYSVFLFSIGSILFWPNLVQNVKIVSLSWSLVPRLIRIFRIQWWCPLFPFSTRNPFWVNLVQKNQNCLFKLKLSIQTNSNMQNLIVKFTFSVLNRK